MIFTGGDHLWRFRHFGSAPSRPHRAVILNRRGVEPRFSLGRCGSGTPRGLSSDDRSIDAGSLIIRRCQRCHLWLRGDQGRSVLGTEVAFGPVRPALWADLGKLAPPKGRVLKMIARLRPLCLDERARRGSGSSTTQVCMHRLARRNRGARLREECVVQRRL